MTNYKQRVIFKGMLFGAPFEIPYDANEEMFSMIPSDLGEQHTEDDLRRAKIAAEESGLIGGVVFDYTEIESEYESSLRERFNSFRSSNPSDRFDNAGAIVY